MILIAVEKCWNNCIRFSSCHSSFHYYRLHSLRLHKKYLVNHSHRSVYTGLQGPPQDDRTKTKIPIFSVWWSFSNCSWSFVYACLNDGQRPSWEDQEPRAAGGTGGGREISSSGSVMFAGSKPAKSNSPTQRASEPVEEGGMGEQDRGKKKRQWRIELGKDKEEPTNVVTIFLWGVSRDSKTHSHSHTHAHTLTHT